MEPAASDMLVLNVPALNPGYVLKEAINV